MQNLDYNIEGVWGHLAKEEPESISQAEYKSSAQSTHSHSDSHSPPREVWGEVIIKSKTLTVQVIQFMSYRMRNSIQPGSCIEFFLLRFFHHCS